MCICVCSKRAISLGECAIATYLSSESRFLSDLADSCCHAPVTNILLVIGRNRGTQGSVHALAQPRHSYVSFEFRARHILERFGEVDGILAEERKRRGGDEGS